MARRDLLTPDARQILFGVPTERENLARNYVLSTKYLALVARRRGDTNQIGFAVQPGLLRHPGFGFALDEGAPTELVGLWASKSAFRQQLSNAKRTLGVAIPCTFSRCR